MAGRYTREQIASFQSGAAKGSQIALLMCAIAGAAAQEQESIEAGTRFQPPQTPRVDGREITVDVSQV